MQAPIITFTTDWGTKDFFIGMVKGRILSEVPDANIIDITHNVTPYKIIYATMVVRHACLNFPKETIHIIDVNSEPKADQPFIIARYKGHYFICADNGLPYSVFGNECESVTRIPYTLGNSNSFIGLTLFTELAIRLAKCEKPSSMGESHSQLLQRNLLEYNLRDNKLSVTIVHNDSYGNAYLGITRAKFEEIRNGREFILDANGGKITTISPYYTTDNEDLALIESATGLLQIALYQSSAAQLLNLKSESSVQFTFKSKSE